MQINESIRALRRQLGLTQDQFAARLKIKRSLVGAYEEGRAEPRLELIRQMARLGRISLESFLAGPNAKGIFKNTPPAGPKEVLVVTVDTQQRDNIQLVPHKAAAGYLGGYADPEFISELPAFRLPNLPAGTYRAFEITGDSMLPLLPGTIIVGEYVENLSYLRNGKTYVLVTKNEGIVYKRVFNYLSENGKLFLVSDNRQYAPYPLAPEEVLEAWQAKAFISVQFPEGAGVQDVLPAVEHTEATQPPAASAGKSREQRHKAKK
jgi:transcriptional regulator with XRE-family HTH domain